MTPDIKLLVWIQQNNTCDDPFISIHVGVSLRVTSPRGFADIYNSLKQTYSKGKQLT